jgi:colanic acid biosynthesis glycosyl transferase WcaI
MRILIYGINFAPELTGIGKYSGEMAAFLAEKGHEVRMITTPPYYPQWQILPGYKGTAYTQEVWQGVTVYRCPLWVPTRSARRPQISGLQRIFHLVSFAISSMPVALKQIGWHPDRVIVLAPSIFNAPLAALVARLAGGKSWLHIQDFELDAALRLKMLPGLGVFFRMAAWAEATLYRTFDCVSTISNRMLVHLAQKGLPPNRMVLFPNWVDTRQIFPINGYNILRHELKLNGRHQIILYSGNMGQKQGLEVLVEAARRLVNENELLFLLCGEGAAKPQLEILTKDLPNIRFLPIQPLERLNELLNLADIHILPQSAAAADLVMPSKLTGMLASGRPVIVTAHPGTELANVMDGLGRVVPPDSPDKLADAILSLIHQPEVQVELGRRGRDFVERTWAKELVLERFLLSLQSL